MALLQVLTSVLWVTDPEGNFVSLQRSWGEYTGQSWEAQRGRGWLQAIHPDDRPEILRQIEQAQQNRRFFYAEGRLWHQASQSYRYYEARGAPIFSDDGEIVEWVGTVKDVDEQRRAAQALRDADRHKDEFIAILAHELRNPLAPIRNAASILKHRGKQDLQLAWARDVIERQTALMARLLDDLLDINRIRQGKIHLDKSRVTLDGIIGTALEVSRPLIEQKGHRLELNLLVGPLYLEADPHRLSQVVVNLLNNAAKYSPPGSRIALKLQDENDVAVISVIDNGIGIAPEMLPRVFNMFTQASASLHGSPGGLGIGLSVARTLTEMHGGSLEARSEGLGRGSEFILRIPLARARAGGPSGAAATPAEGPRLQLVVADDNTDAAETLAVLLELSGHEVRVGTSGQEALDLCRASRPDAALLDLGMPGLSGYEVARTLRTEQPDIFLVAISGWAQEEDLQRAREAGFDRHCAKPVEPEQLAELLAQRRPR